MSAQATHRQAVAHLAIAQPEGPELGPGDDAVLAVGHHSDPPIRSVRLTFSTIIVFNVRRVGHGRQD